MASRESFIRRVLQEHISSQVIGKSFSVKDYPSLQFAIPDEAIQIEECIDENELELILERFNPFLKDMDVCPVMITLGGNAICVGYGSNNLERTYYYDFDFGLFDLGVPLKTFLGRLVLKDIA